MSAGTLIRIIDGSLIATRSGTTGVKSLGLLTAKAECLQNFANFAELAKDMHSGKMASSMLGRNELGPIEKHNEAPTVRLQC